MNVSHDTWAIVLAAGEGTRLRSLTTRADGLSTPKQYCSLFGGRSLLQDALRRGRALVRRDRLCAVVAAHHADWWRGLRRTLAPGNLVVQPVDRGTAHGVLLPLLLIAARDPTARVIFLPSDHHVADEARLYAALLATLRAIECTAGAILLVGIEPDEPDGELGYIVPGPAASGPRRVARFVEKPAVDVAAALIGDGALWNSFIFAGTARSLLSLFELRTPATLAAMAAAVPGRRGTDLGAVYKALPRLDLSADLLAGSEQRLRVVSARGCGWTDLGTPRRIGALLGRTRTDQGVRDGWLTTEPACGISLATAWQRAYVRAHHGEFQL